MVFLCLLLSGCFGGKGKNVSTQGQSSQGNSSLISIKPGDQVKLDSVEKFIQLYVLFNYAQKEWVEEVDTNSVDTNVEGDVGEGGDIFGPRRKAFFESYGLTEAEFVSYSSSNFKQIQAFLRQNPEYKKLYEDSVR